VRLVNPANPLTPANPASNGHLSLSLADARAICC
jgi:hypothetical protein